MTRPRSAAASWVLAALAAVALAVGGLLVYADRTVFRSDPFADRAATAFATPAVRDATARRLTDLVIAVRPDLVAVRPVIGLAAQGIAGTPQFRSLVRAAVLQAHRSAFDEEHARVTLRIRDAGVLLGDALERLRPGLANRLPTRFAAPVV